MISQTDPGVSPIIPLKFYIAKYFEYLNYYTLYVFRTRLINENEKKIVSLCVLKYNNRVSLCY